MTHVNIKVSNYDRNLFVVRRRLRFSRKRLSKHLLNYNILFKASDSIQQKKIIRCSDEGCLDQEAFVISSIIIQYELS